MHILLRASVLKKFLLYSTRIRLRAMVDLQPGQQLQHSYSYTLNGTTQRQEHLRTGKYFSCECKRCKDPTELATNFSTFKCSKCEEGWLLWSDPLGECTIILIS